MKNYYTRINSIFEYEYEWAQTNNQFLSFYVFPNHVY